MNSEGRKKSWRRKSWISISFMTRHLRAGNVLQTRFQMFLLDERSPSCYHVSAIWALKNSLITADRRTGLHWRWRSWWRREAASSNTLIPQLLLSAQSPVRVWITCIAVAPSPVLRARRNPPPTPSTAMAPPLERAAVSMISVTWNAHRPIRNIQEKSVRSAASPSSQHPAVRETFVDSHGTAVWRIETCQAHLCRLETSSTSTPQSLESSATINKRNPINLNKRLCFNMRLWCVSCACEVWRVHAVFHIV